MLEELTGGTGTLGPHVVMNLMTRRQARLKHQADEATSHHRELSLRLQWDFFRRR